MRILDKSKGLAICVVPCCLLCNLVWLIQFAAFMIPTIPRYYLIYLCAAILGPLQGFLNVLVVFCQDRKSSKRRVSQSMKKLLPLFNIKFTSSGSSEVVSADLAGGNREPKQSVQHSVENEAAAQPEIGVGQLDRLEEEDKTPEAASDGEGDESDEDYDENDEGLLEHAINADILNDDDREIFRVSIARIQSTSSGFVVERNVRFAQEENQTTAQQDTDTSIRR